MTKNALQTNDPVTQRILSELRADKKRFWAGDNIAEYVSEKDRASLVNEAAEKLEGVLDSLLIDHETDPNSKETARRIAKMYINELFSGRYDEKPPVTAFPNTEDDDRYEGILITKAEIKSVCSHHHQPVTGVCWIGLIPSTHVIGLSKYARLAQWHARRGTLQEELTRRISDEIKADTKSKDVAVIISATHGCCSNRGIMAHDSTTITSVLSGQFYNPSVKEEFHRLITNYKVLSTI